MRIVFTIVLAGFCVNLWAQVWTNNGAAITVGSASTISVEGDIQIQLDGDVDLDGTIEVSGDITNNSSTRWVTAGAGVVELNGAALQTVTGSSEIDFYDFTLDNSSTGAELGTNINVSNTLTMTDGDFHLNGDTIDLSTTGSLIGEANANRIYGLTGALTAVRTLNAPAGVNIAGTGCEITSAANLGVTSLVRRHQTYVTQGGTSIFRNFLIEPTTNTGLNATLRFHYFENELNAVAETDLQAYKSINGGTTWDFKAGTATPASDFHETVTIDDFSLWTLAYSVILPIRWLEFEAEVIHDDEVLLEWAVALEGDGAYYIVERSVDGVTFEGLDVIHGTVNTSHTLVYDFHDTAPHGGINYYQVRKVDREGEEEVSPVRSINLRPGDIHVFPSVLTSETPISVTGLHDFEYEFVLYDARGIELLRSELHNGEAEYEIEHEELPAGQFYYKLFEDHNQVLTGKLTVVK